MKQFQIILLTFTLILMSSCVGTKESKRIKRGSGVIKDSKVLLFADYEGTVGFINVSIRENNFFSINTNSMFWWDYYAGTYEVKNDTIHLKYIDNHKLDKFANYIYIHKDTLYIPTTNSTKAYKLIISYNNLLRK